MDLGPLNLKKNLVEWRFNRFPKYMTLSVNINYKPAQKVQNVVFAEAVPRTFNSNIRLVCVSEDALTDILDMVPDIASQRDFMEFLSGKKFPKGAVPVAHRYGGHQYGIWVGQLGDGRAHIIGEYVNRVGERWQIQLKGLGPTPFSRIFDGRTVLRSSIREMIVSEALYHLGVPTIRTAVLAVSNDAVVRDKFYTGSPQHERASVALRLSPSWLRFGSFEILAKCGELQVLRQLADFVIQEHFPDIHVSDDNRYLRLFSEISQRSLDLVVKWQGLGFTHGLLNSDNMSLLGLSLGFGPFGFLDCYDEGFVANSSDKQGRYAFMKQPDVVIWNIFELAKTFKSLLSPEQQTHLSQIVKTFDAYCKSKILATFLLKIGLKEERWDDDQLLEKLLDMMQGTGADFTATFRQLAELEPSELLNPVKLEGKWSLKRLSSHSSYGVWVEQYRDRIQKESVTACMLGSFELERRRRMLSVNPVYVPRNWLLEESIDDAESNNFEKVRILLEVLRNPYVTQIEAESRGYSAQPPEWAYATNVPTEALTGKLHLVCASDTALADILDLDPKVAETEEFIDFVAGKFVVEGGLTVCHRYGGYQFGFWSDQLGDGRAHALGEYVNSKGESWQPQLKGSGETPYSRFGDGRAVLRSSIREMVASEACYHLGVPTTRAGALVVSDEHKVWRDKTYSGHARQERAAVVLRLAPAWYRLGSLEILYKRHETELMRRLADFIIEHHFPHISGDDKYVKWFSEVAHRNLDMVAAWQGVGFTHGVLNTDNISVLGLTIDYGPYGFMDHYYESFVPNSSDDRGRYAFDKQPQIVIWNLEKFAEALSAVLTEEQAASVREIVAGLQDYVGDKILQTYLRKLGLSDTREGDIKLVGELMVMMQQTTSDFTATFRQMGEVDIDDLTDSSALESKWSLAKISQAKDWASWVHKYRQRFSDAGVSEEQRCTTMCGLNPIYVPRNWILQEAIADAEKNDFAKVRLLLKIFEKPYETNDEAEKLGYSAQPPSWSYGLKLSCSS